MKKIKLGNLGAIDIAAGMLLMVLGKILPGLILLLIGLCAVAMHYATLMRGMGHDPEQGLYHGMGGQGKQQSETVDANLPEPGEQTPGIWEKMTK
jgi:hypothetical protein